MPTTSGATILVVEDDSTIRRLIHRVLSRAGFTLIEAAGGRAAEAALHLYPSPFDLVILDIVMPDGNGLDFANHLQLVRPGSPILYISGYGDSVAVDAITRQTPDHILTKPFTPGQLLDRVRSLCGAPDQSGVTPT